MKPGVSIREARRQSGMTQWMLCKAARISRQTLSRIEHGAHVTDAARLRVCAALKVNPVDVAAPAPGDGRRVRLPASKALNGSPVSAWRIARVTAGLTLTEVAAATGLSVSHLSALERGIVGLSPETAARLSKALPLKGTI